MRRRPTGLRGRLTVAVLVAVALALGGLLVAFNLVLDHVLDSEANNVVDARATSELATLETVEGRLVVGETPDDAELDRQIWVFAGIRALERPRAPAAVDAAARRLAGGPRRRVDVASRETRLLALPVVEKGRRVGTVVAGVSLRPYEKTERIALMGSVSLAAVLLLVAVLVARLTLTAALRPVARMTESAESWSEHDLDRRFRPGPPHDELTQLASTLDGLLDRLAAGLRREQSLTSEISHELRTPLTKLMAEAQLTLRDSALDDPARESLERIGQSAADMATTLEVLLHAARAAATGSPGHTDLFAVATRAVEDQDTDVATEVVRPDASVFAAVDPNLVERILAPILENARRHARSRVAISIAPAANGMAELTVRDDGPGVAADDVEKIFVPGAGGVPGTGQSGGSGARLGLALARRLAAAAGGSVVAHAGDGGRFTVALPRA
jgi:two-component system, OmpR family, sensor kinase